MTQSQYEPRASEPQRMDDTTEMGQNALGQASEAATVVRDAVKQHPFTTLAFGGRPRVRGRCSVEATAVKQGQSRAYTDGAAV